MPQFLLFLFLTAGAIALLYGLANANVATLAHNVRRGAIVVLSVIAIALIVVGRWAYALPLFFLVFSLYRAGGMGGFGSRSSADRKSRVKSSFLAMELDHGSGDMDGEVLRGSLSGRRLNDLDDDDISVLVEEVADDEQSADLLEAYLERRQPGWRTRDSGADKAKPGLSNQAMTPDEAREVLGVAPNATDREIRAAHRAMMKDMHPDQGGSTYFAAKLNQARDILLRKPSRQR